MEGGFSLVSHVYFLHIPRTMGTALKDQCLYPNYDPQDVILDLNWEHCLNLDKSRFSNSRLICGHIPYNISGVLGYTPSYITMIRHPVYRSKSMYKFCRRTKWHYLHHLAKDMTFMEFLSDDRCSSIVSNAHARHICCDLTPQEIRDIAGEDSRNAMDEAFYQYDIGDNLINRSINRLKEFFFIGVADEFYRSVNHLWRILGISDPVLGPDMKKQMNWLLKSNIYQIYTNELQRIIELNKADMAIYEYAIARLRQDAWRSAGGSDGNP